MISEFHQWFYTALATDWVWAVYASRTVTLYSIILLLYFTFRLWREVRVWHLLWLFIPNLFLLVYYIDVLYIKSDLLSISVTPSQVFFNLLIAFSYLSGFSVADQLRHHIKKGGDLEDKRRRLVVSFWNWRKEKRTIPEDPKD